MIVYLITNTLNRKQYVGQTRYSLEERWRCHCKDARRGSVMQLHQAIRKYGHDAFQLSVLFVCSSQEELDRIEKACIVRFDTYKNGYNATLGGQGCAGQSFTVEVRQRMSASLKAYYASPENRAQHANIMRRSFEKHGAKDRLRVVPGVNQTPAARGRRCDARKIANGLCRRGCGRPIAVNSKSRCIECLAAARRQYRSRHTSVLS